MQPPVRQAPASQAGSITCDDFNRPDNPDGLGAGALGLWRQWIENPPEIPDMVSIENGEALIRSNGISTFGSGIKRYIDLQVGLEPPFEVFLEHRVWIPGDWAAQGPSYEGPSYLNVQFGLSSIGAFDDFASPALHFYQGGLSFDQVQGETPTRKLNAYGRARRSQPTVWASGSYVFDDSYADGDELFTRVRVSSPNLLYVKSWYVGEAEPEAFIEIPVASPPPDPLRFLTIENESRGWNYTMPETIPDPQPDWRIDKICVDIAPPPVLHSRPVPPETEHNEHPNEETSGDPVSTYSGALTDSHRDVAIPGRGPAIDFTRSYHSNDPRVGAFGPGWTHNYATHVHPADDDSGDLYLIGPQGRSDRYTKQPNGTFEPPPAVATDLVANPDGTFAATHKDQSRWTFDTGGRLTAIIDRYGNPSTMTYGAGGRLVGIGDPAGRGTLVLGYTNGLLTSLTDWATPARVLTYEYDANGRLWKVTDREGKTTTYSYDAASHRIATITNARGKVVQTNTYDAQGRVATQQDARGVSTGDVTTFDYVVNPDGTRLTTTTAPATSYEPSFQPTVVDTYDANGWLVERETRPALGETYTQSFTYDGSGNRTSVTDQRGSRTDFCYDVSFAGTAIAGSVANLTRVIGPAPTAGADRPVALTLYDAKNNIVQKVAPKGVPSSPTVTCSTDLSSVSIAHAVDYTFDAGGVFLLAETTRSTDPELGLRTAVTKLEYGDSANPGLVTRSIPPRGNTGASPDYTFATTRSYYTTGAMAGRLKDETNPLGDKESFDYDAVGRLTASIGALGNVAGATPAHHRTEYVYDKEDRIRFVRLPAPIAGGSQLVTESRYDEVGNPTVRIDANGQVTTLAYDDRNSLFQVKESPLPWTDPASPPAQVFTTEYTRDAGGNPTRITRAKGDSQHERVLDYVYDGRGLPRSEVQYPSWPSTTGPLVTTFSYDGAGNQTTLVDPLEQTMTVGYDASNRRTSLGYSDPATPDVTFAYDANGNRAQMVDGTGTTTYSYDEGNRPIAVTSPGASTVGYRYDVDGNRTKLIYPDGTAVTYAFDKAGRMASLSDWASRSVTYTYWPDGLLKTAINPDGSTATRAYDNARRLVDVAHRQSSGAVISRSFYTLDPDGNVITEADGDLAAQFARPDGAAGSSGTWTGSFASISENPPNDTTFLASPVSPTTSHFYEVSLSDADLPGSPAGITFRYRYAKSGNNSGKTTNLTVELRQGTTVIASQVHTNIPGVNGSGWQQGALTLTTAQAELITNAADLRLRFRPSSSGGGQGRSAQVSWAEVQLPGAGHPSTLVTNTYDALNRLTGVGEQSASRSYTYDPAGNRLTRTAGSTTTYVYDRADRMTAAGATSVSVDANGNLTATGSDAYAFDQANRLTSATIAGVTETYVYDGNGTRISRQVGSGSPIPYVSDTSGPLSVVLTDETRKYVHGQGLAYSVAGSALEVYHPDRLGSVRALTNAAGTTTATYDADEWGRRTTTTGASTQPFEFTGQLRDGTGFTYLRTRYYSPDLGRYLSRDTWPGVPSEPQTQNRYSYVANNPVTALDPSGRILDTVADVAFIIYDVGALIFGPEKDRGNNWLALGADIAGAATPFFTGGGMLVRAGAHGADFVDDAVGATRWVDDASRPTAVLGRYPEYLDLADASGSKVFNIPKEAWDQMSDAERWAANQKFLDDVIASGDDVLLASPITDGGTYARELDYMLANGYLLSPDGWKLLAP